MNATHVVAQPYCDYREHCNDGPTWNLLAAKYGFEVSFPPNPQASTHSPGHCIFAVLHERSHIVRWLPEQLR